MAFRRLALRVSSSSSDSEAGAREGGDADVSFEAASGPVEARSPFLVQVEDEDDEDEVQVLDIDPPPPPPPPPPFRGPSDTAPAIVPTAILSALESLLHSFGIHPTSQWLAACVRSLTVDRPGFSQLPLSQQAECCLARFLVADLNTMGSTILPPQVHTLHATEISGPFVLQVDEIADIGSAIRDRFKEKSMSSKRCLKLSMTDGVQRVYGIEYRPIKDLMVLLPAGFKIAIRQVNIRRGLLMLVPEVVAVLGGHVQSLEAARERFVQHVNKPPRGTRVSRTERGCENPSLAERAAAAAWPANNSLRRDKGAISQLSSTHNAGNTDAIAQQNEGNIQRRAQGTQTFTYTSLLSKRWLENQACGDRHDRIKCVLTGVKEFQFKNQDTFRLFVYVDDGSQITSVMINHRIVESLIGCSPGQASSALASTNLSEVTTMKETLSRFQAFLTNFEGIMLLKQGDDSDVPIVEEMVEGVQNCEAWSLLQRLQGGADLAHVLEDVQN